jgi:hypothetical protein
MKMYAQLLHILVAFCLEWESFKTMTVDKIKTHAQQIFS